MTRGPKPSADTAYAREIGLTPKQVKRLGGSERLKQLAVNHRETWDYHVNYARSQRKS